MPKIRHIAYRADDVEGMASFFVKAIEMRVVQRRKNGAVDLADGTINITVLPAQLGRADGQPRSVGIDHIGFTVENKNEASRLLEAAGAQKVDATGISNTAHYEVKFLGPEGIGIDVGHWVGAAPIEDSEGKKKPSLASLLL